MALTGEQSARIEEIYLKMYAPLMAYAVNALGRQTTAEEAVQDVFRIACTKPEVLLTSPNPEGWLVNSLKYVVFNMRRAQAAMARLVEVGQRPEDLDTEGPAGDDLELRLTVEESLSPEEFKLVRMVAEGYSLLEAARELDISLAAVKKRLQRIRDKFRKLL